MKKFAILVAAGAIAASAVTTVSADEAKIKPLTSTQSTQAVPPSLALGAGGAGGAAVGGGLLGGLGAAGIVGGVVVATVVVTQITSGTN